jgi:transposase
MSTQRFTPEFKEDAVKQVLERGYSVAEVGARPTPRAAAGSQVLPAACSCSMKNARGG